MEQINFKEMPNLAKAVISVMKAVKSIDKTSNVGTGASSYKGVEDKEVKLAIGNAMEANGLCMLPVDVEPIMRIDRWQEQDPYKPDLMKSKQQVFTEVKTKYLLLHESGEFVILTGYGHGVDSQDKSAGKATTYALKYALLYAFMVPTGKIDDADNHHSNDTQTPVANKKAQQPANALAPAAQPEPKKETPFMTIAQVNKALESDVKGIEATLKAINSGQFRARETDKKSLEDKLSELKKATK